MRVFPFVFPPWISGPLIRLFCLANTAYVAAALPTGLRHPQLYEHYYLDRGRLSDPASFFLSKQLLQSGVVTMLLYVLR